MALTGAKQRGALPATLVSAPGRWRRGLITRPLIDDLLEQEVPLADDDDLHPATWHKDVQPTPNRLKPIYPPRPTPPRIMVPAPYVAQPRRRTPPGIVVWASLLVMIALVLSGVFGVFVSLGRGLAGTPDNGDMALEVTPGSIAINGVITLRGVNFSPNTHVGLTRDNALPMWDTSGDTIITTDANGSFSDTVQALQNWGAGPHTLNAEDATTHKLASFPILVTGQSGPSRPAHLYLSQESLDLGIGDPSESTVKTVALTNTGGSPISWQAHTAADWLLVSPAKGTLLSGQSAQIKVAVDRSSLSPGPYSTKITFDSGGGSDTINVKMQVTALQPGHEAVMQLSPSVLSFTATDAAAPPSPQTIIISNPGALPLNWKASSDSNWLSAFPQSDTVAKGGKDPVAISVNTSSLLPGTYNGSITFASQGTDSVQNAPQTVYVNVTIGARCTLSAQPSLLTFTSVYRLSTPAAQNVSLGTGQNCQNAIPWTATTNANWLTISAKNGKTPTNPSVGIDTTGLVPGVYHGNVVFSSAMGTQTVAVTYTMGESTTPLLGVTSGSLTFNGVAGQNSSQSITISNTGGGSLKWSASATTSSGGNWLSVSPSSGQIASQPTNSQNVPASLLGAGMFFGSSTSGQMSANQSSTLTVSASLPKSLAPGTYNGAITINATDSSGNLAGGSPRTIGVSLVVQGACGVSSSADGLNFTTGADQATPSPQDLTLSIDGACSHPINWKATLNGSWLNASSTSGQIASKGSGSLSVSVQPAGLQAGTYHGSVTITTTDSVTNNSVGSTLQIPVTFAVQSACTLQAPSQSGLGFQSEAGKGNPSSQSFTVKMSGACSGSTTVTRQITYGSGSNWLSVSPSSASLSAGQSATFTVSVNAQNLSAGSYTARINLDSANGSPQSVGVSLAVQGLPVLNPSPRSLTFTGSASLPVSISNDGGTTMNWTASLTSNAHSIVSLSKGSGSLDGNASTTIYVVVDASGVTGSKGQISTSLLIKAFDASTGKAAANSPVSVPITINISSITPTPTDTPTPTPTVVPPTKVPTTPTVPTTKPSPTVTVAPVTPTVIPTKGPTPGSSPPPSSPTSVAQTPTPTPVDPAPTPTPTIVQPTPTATSIPTPTSEPTRVQVTPTSVPTPIPTPTPTSKPTRVVVPTPTPTFVPTPTPTPKYKPTRVTIIPTPEPEPVPTPTPTPESKPTRVVITPVAVPTPTVPRHKPTPVVPTPTPMPPTPTIPPSHGRHHSP